MDDSNQDGFYWPTMDPHAHNALTKEVSGKGNTSQKPASSHCVAGHVYFQYYEIPKPHAYCTNTKYQAVYSMWNHFTDYLDYHQWRGDGTKIMPPKCNNNLEKVNLYSGKRRLPIFIDLADGKRPRQKFHETKRYYRLNNLM